MNPKLLKEPQESFVPKPTAKTAKRTRSDEMWLLFVKACGGRCCVCFNDGPLHRGHIQRHADGGLAIFENLIPLCKSCNSKYKSGFTPDGRKEGWRDAFLKLLLAEMNLGIMCKHIQSCADTSLGDKPVKTTGFMDLQNVEFVPQFHYKTHAPHTSTPQPLSPSSAERLMWDLIKRSEQNAIPPKPPYKKRQDAMMLAAIKHGHDAFRIAGEEFLRREPWIIDERGNGIIQQDSWQHFCDCFVMYLADGRARRVRLAAQEMEARKRELEWQERQRVYERECRWKEFLRVATVPAFDGLTQEEDAFVSTVAAEKAAGPRDLTEEEFERSRDICQRYLICLRKKLISQVGALIKATHREDWSDRLLKLLNRTRDAKDIPTLQDCEAVAQQFAYDIKLEEPAADETVEPATDDIPF